MLAARPWHRAPPQASPADRAAMLRLAVDDANAGRLAGRGKAPSGGGNAPMLLASDHEGVRDGPSYTVSTLAGLAGDEPIVWLLGDDAAASIASWHRARELATLCHLLVFARAGARVRGADAPPPGFRPVADPAAFREHRSGRVHYLGARALEISATRIRQRIARQEDAGALLPPRVWAYIRGRGLYGAARTPCASAGALREAAGGALSKQETSRA